MPRNFRGIIFCMNTKNEAILYKQLLKLLSVFLQ